MTAICASQTQQLDTAVHLLRGGGVVAIPTDTLYGLAAAASDAGAVERLYQIKGRPATMAVPLLIADESQLDAYSACVSEAARKLARAFFPGALTLVVPKGGLVLDVVSGGGDSIALRVPDHPVPREIVRQLGGAITGTSANRSGAASPTTAQDVRSQIGAEVDMIVDGGECRGGVASTVVDVTGPLPMILRHGSVSKEELEAALGMEVNESVSQLI